MDFNTSGAGKHNFVEMPIQVSDPSGASNEFTLFSKTNTGGNNELFYKRDNAGSSFQLSGTDPTRATKGHTFLPGGLLLQWNLEGTVNDNSSYTFLTPFAASPYSITLTPVRNATAVRSMYIKDGSVSSSGFSIRTSSGSFNGLYWMAIGPGPAP
ncbi:MAG: hypothetical protein ACLFUW_00235 [Bacteroidales bacterium]